MENMSSMGGIDTNQFGGGHQQNLMSPNQRVNSDQIEMVSNQMRANNPQVNSRVRSRPRDRSPAAPQSNQPGNGAFGQERRNISPVGDPKQNVSRLRYKGSISPMRQK